MEHKSTRLHHGLTAIELLIFVAFVALVVAFAVPFANSTLNKSKVARALDITEKSVMQARRTARFYQTDVLMKIQSGEEQSPSAITLTVPDLQRDPTLNEMKNQFALPEGVRLVGGDMVIRFDPHGEVEWPTLVTIVSDQHGDINEMLLIE